MKKLIAIILVGTLLVSFVSAGVFYWSSLSLVSVIKPYKPAFNISNDFSIKKLSLDKKLVLAKLKALNLKKFKLLPEKDLSVSDLNISKINYFKINSQGIIRFKYE